ncbi:MAG: calcium/sodium antiporter [Deltaproteobacteria bacterium]
MTTLLFILGLVILIIGAESLVRGASRLAASLGISPLIIGLTVVAFGTSSPEMAVSVISSINHQADISLGNVIGSNIFNVLFILGLSALIAPLLVSRQLIRLDVPIMIGCSFLVLLMSLGGNISRLDGIILLAGIIAYTAFLVREGKKEKKAPADEFAREYGQKGKKTVIFDILLVMAGLAMLVLGSRWLVNGAVYFAQYFGVSELIIGLTIVAVGTSLPEVATSVVASARGERDIAVGNIVGSNIFNLLAVLGLAGIFSPEGIQVSKSVLNFDMPVMIAVAAACLPIFFTGNIIARWEGGLFLVYYIAYTLYIVLSATNNYLIRTFVPVMIWFVMPLTALTLIVLFLRSARKNRVEKL